ncbi:MAG: hypothetical protein ACOYXA_15540 [Bacteroidota bacterium]
MSTVLFENKHLTIRHHKEDQILILTWRGFIPSVSFRELACEIIKAVDESNVRKILSDNREWKIISPNDQGWAANQWFPKAEEKGVQALATVRSNDIFNREAERNVEAMANLKHMLVKNFKTEEEALRWLKSADH